MAERGAMTPRETLEKLQHWIRSALDGEQMGLTVGMEGVEPPRQAEADAAIRAVLEELDEVKAICINLMNDADPSLREENERLQAEAGHKHEWALRLQKENERLRASMVDHFQKEHIEGDGPEIDRWKARIEAALALHPKHTIGDLDYCPRCSHRKEVYVAWPCPTVKALRGEDDRV
jgi:hypothetical protein